MYCSLHESAWTVKAKYAADIGMLQNDLQNSFEKIYIKKDFFPPFFSKTFERDTFMNSFALRLGKNNSWVQNSKSKNVLPSMLKVNQMIYKNKTFPNLGLLSTFNLPTPSCSKTEIMKDSCMSLVQILTFMWLLTSSFYGQTVGMFEVLMPSLYYKSTL